jgi:hypothetical protein
MKSPLEAMIRHLEMIQTIISRMAGNSFLLKGWSVTLVAALFALAAKDSNPLFLFVAYVPCICFWALDGYFLRQERLFRRLYDHVRKFDDTAIDFSMDTTLFKADVQGWLRTMFSITIVAFHGVVLVTIIVFTTWAISFK